MLPKEHRLTKEKDFENVFKNGVSFFTKILGIRYAKNNLNITRCGIIVSQKISKKATARNKIKRRLREILRFYINDIISGYDLIVLTRAEIADKEYEKIFKDLEYILKRTGLKPKGNPPCRRNSPKSKDKKSN